MLKYIIRLGESQMKQILYEDNNNAKYLMNILAQGQQQVETVIRNDVFLIKIFDGDII
jgi:hypothetical protein